MGGHGDLAADVLVVGAGAAGVPAAVAAARAGARAILIEDDPAIGGAPSDYYVCLFYGGDLQGIMAEVGDLLSTRYAAVPGSQFFPPESWQRAFWHLLQQEPDVQVIPGARAVGILHGEGTENPTVAGVTVETVPGESFDIRCRVTIDATGSGVIAALAGCSVMYGREARSEFDEPTAPLKSDDQTQHCTWMYFAQRTGVGKPLDVSRLTAGGAVGVLEGIAPRGEEKTWRARIAERQLGADPGIHLVWGCSIPCRDTRDPVELARTHQDALAAMEHDHTLLREHGFAIYLAPRIGVRECRRIAGEHVITENEIRAGRFPEDTIAACDYGLDIWDAERDCERGVPVARYGIPYRALVPKGVDGLLVAGKCMSGTHAAQSSFRVMPIAGKTGQAAGVAAALCAKFDQQPRALDPDEVRDVLRTEEQHLPLSFDEA